MASVLMLYLVSDELWDNIVTLVGLLYWYSGGRLNKKDGLTRYGNSHVKDKTS